MPNVKLKRLGKNATVYGKLKVRFADEANPLTDKVGNPRIIGADEEGNPVYEFEELVVEVDPGTFADAITGDITDTSVYDALDDAADKALVRAVESIERRAKTEKVKTILEGLTDTTDGEVVFEGDVSLIEMPEEVTREKSL